MVTLKQILFLYLLMTQGLISEPQSWPEKQLAVRDRKKMKIREKKQVKETLSSSNLQLPFGEENKSPGLIF